ncbi:hypothetical protein [Actinomadura sp. 9N407]|uniref:hypothetical protein n=1 Tax=Actinomadura sp. 9N407 TaxID=3375154 RepID=UPI003795DAEC
MAPIPGHGAERRDGLLDAPATLVRRGPESFEYSDQEDARRDENLARHAGEIQPADDHMCTFSILRTAVISAYG